MGISRYNETKTIHNNDLGYAEVFAERYNKRTSLPQYETINLEYPTAEDLSRFAFKNEIWKRGDRLHKYAEKYYGDPTYWWVIAWFNKKPTEAHIKTGELIKIPTPVEEILNYYGL